MVKLLELLLIAFASVVTCESGWCAAVDRRSSDDCSYVSVEVWRRHRPERTFIDVDIEGASCRR